MTVRSYGEQAPAPRTSFANFRVLRCYFRLPPEPGGMEAHIAGLSEAQRALGVEVVNVFNTGQCDAPSVQLLKSIDLLPVRPAFLRNMFFYGAAYRQRRRLLDARPTILHAHGDWSDFLLAKWLARTIGANAVAASLHDRVPRAKAALYRRALNGCDPIFATGKADQLYLEDLLGRPVHHLPSAPRPAFFSAGMAGPPFEYEVISVANFAAKKAPELVLECAKLRRDYRFVMFGDGDLRPQIMHRATRDGVLNLELPGRRPIGEIIEALQRSRVFLLTARREGTPTAALEAMAVGLPVVLTPSNDYGWLIESGCNGYVTEGWTPDEIMARVDDVLADEARRQRMMQANRTRAARHSWTENARIVTRLMEESLSRRADAE